VLFFLLIFGKVKLIFGKVKLIFGKVKLIDRGLNMSIHADLRAPKILKTCKGLKNKQKRFDTE